MADEEKIQKQVEFIIEQQAQFAANMKIAEEHRSKIEEQVTKVENLVDRQAVATTNRFKKLAEKVSAVVNAQVRTEEALTALAAKMAGLAESQANTDQRLNALIDIIRKSRNGQSQN